MSEETNRRTALLVDDEPDILELLSLTLSRMGLECRTASRVAQAHLLLERHRFDFCLTDMRLPDGNGIDLVRHSQQVAPGMPVAVITAHGSMNAAIEALKAGAFDFVTKPVELKALRTLVETALRLTPEAEPVPASDRRLLGDSRAMQEIRSLVARLARSQAPVYISGESGTGKELVARLIHEQGPRADAPFVAINCGAVPTELMESEFFGHKRGSFTGAASDKEGLFQSADGGTLFLDEIAELPLHMQVKLLRAIQEKSVRPVGATKEIPVDVRILSATHRDLAARVEAGTFRSDLFYRINVIPVCIPSLRERPEDIPPLADRILRRLAAESGTAQRRLSEAALQALIRHPFPGNVRELENVLERALTLAADDEIGPDDLNLTPAVSTSEPRTDYLAETFDLETHLERIERTLIEKALDQTDQNKTAAARRLGISFRSLRYRLKKLGME